MKISTIFVFLIVLLRSQACEVSFRSVSSIEKLLSTQAHLIQSLGECQHFVFKKERRIVKAYLSKLKQDHALLQSDPEHYLGNPINAFTLISRLTRDLRIVENILNNTKMYKRNDSLVYPEKKEAKGAIDGIILLQLMYGLDIPQLANGTLITHFRIKTSNEVAIQNLPRYFCFSKSKQRYVEYVTPMTANDCYDLAMLNFDPNDKRRHVAWLEEAYKRYETDHLLCSFSEEELIGRIGAQYFFMENWNKTIYWLKRNLAINPDDSKLKTMLNDIRKRSEDEHSKLRIQNRRAPKVPDKRSVDTNSTIMRLCRDDSSSTPTNASIYCYYAHGPHPYLLLAPFRAELLHRRPDVTLFYHVSSDAETQIFKTYAKPLLQNSMVIEDDTPSTPKVSGARTSQTTTLPHQITEVARVLSRMHQVTGLRLRDVSDPLVIGNYGIGGYYAPHVDYTLSNVEQGGATAFLNLNLTIFPVKNAAVFWFNLDSWGNPDSKSRHAACPVLRGSKWVANKWIAQIDQDLSRVCPTHPPEPKVDLGQELEHQDKGILDGKRQFQGMNLPIKLHNVHRIK